MCGIILAISNKQAIDRKLFNEARNSMHHRGPDAAGSAFLHNGCVAIGHRRLSILDLSDAANQPMQLDSLWITYNGEIYNYPELRSFLETKGCCFRTNSDTEVLLHGYRIWGEDICNQLSGMFAFAIWNDATRKLFLVRDHIGQKPLYYAQVNHHYIVASEIKAIRILIGNSLNMRKESVPDNIVHGFIPEPYTWYQEIECLLPGHSKVVQSNNQTFTSTTKKYWSFSPDPDPRPISKEKAFNAMGEEIEKAVKSHLLADVEVGALLSGGTDSSCVVAIASRYLSHPIKTFSIGFGSPNGDELPLARETAQQIGTLHKEKIVTKSDFDTSLSKVIQIFDQPFADTSLVPTERISSFAAKDVKVVLTGDGGDEIFGGYNLGHNISPFLNNISRNFPLNKRDLKRFIFPIYDRIYYLTFGEQRWQASVGSPKNGFWKNRLIKLLNNDIAKTLLNYDPLWVHHKYNDPTLDPVRRIQWKLIKISLPGKFLVKVDRCSMHHSLEARSPFLSHTLVETMMNIPTEIRNPRKDWYKGLFRDWLKNKVPNRVLFSPKRGFSPPYTHYPRSSDYNDPNILKHCIDASIINKSAWPQIKRKPPLLWKFLQMERGLEAGIL